MSELCLVRNTSIPNPDPPTFYTEVVDDLSRPVMVERPDSRVVILRILRGTTTPVVVRYGCLLLQPLEQDPWRAAWGVPPWPADPLRYLSPRVLALRAAPEVIPPEIALPLR